MSSFAELAQSIQLALKALAMYTQAHPRCQATLAELHAAVTRWLAERPDTATGLGKLERLALSAIRSGCQKPRQVFAAVAATSVSCSGINMATCP